MGESHPHLAALYGAQGNYDAAEPLYRRSLEIRETALGESHLRSVATSLNNLAGLYGAQGNYDAAEPLYRRSLKSEKPPWESLTPLSPPASITTLRCPGKL
ncbi:tetratricopeptide repeat protein [Phormidium yuhuli]|uniref:tetratricopeptide repeat protein n=1 Tax=Phormidium yuhuli TaxID=2974039 RepID=UPI0028681168|nr:tetratricopeptide repeat protein [Phormidium yuhuli]